MLLFCLLIIQFAVINGDLMCMYSKYPKCYESLIKGANQDFCAGTTRTIECIKLDAIECQVAHSSVVMNIEKKLTDVCQEGTALNEDFKMHGSCVFHISNVESEECYANFIAAIQNYPLTGYKDDDMLGMLKLSCRYSDQIGLCLSVKVFENCGKEASKFYNNFTAPSNDLVARACMESGAGSFNFIWTFLIQASTILFSLTLSTKLAV